MGIRNTENMTEIGYNTSTTTTSTNLLSFPDCQKLVLAECGLDITNTEELGQLATCVKKEDGLAFFKEESHSVISLLETLSRQRTKTIKIIPCKMMKTKPS